MPLFELWMYVMGESLGKNFHSLELWVNLFLLTNLVLMSSQDVCYRKGSAKFSQPWGIFCLFSDVYKALLKLMRWVLFCPLLISMSEAFSVTFTLNKIYTKLWVTETVFGPQVKSPPQRQVWQHCSPFTPKLSYLWLIHVNVWQKPAQLVKNPPSIQETWVQSLDWEDSLEKGTATRSGILTWRIPWTVLVHGVTKRRR